MVGSFSPDIAHAATTIARSHPQVPVLNVLDLVMRGHRGATLDTSAFWVRPSSPFGKVLAAALDGGLTPEEWALGSMPPANPAAVKALLPQWHQKVLLPFAARYELAM